MFRQLALVTKQMIWLLNHIMFFFPDTNVCWRIDRNCEIRNNGISPSVWVPLMANMELHSVHWYAVYNYKQFYSIVLLALVDADYTNDASACRTRQDRAASNATKTGQSREAGKVAGKPRAEKVSTSSSSVWHRFRAHPSRISSKWHGRRRT